MASYVVRVRSPLQPADAFAYMADLTNFARWDPDVKEVVQVEGDGPGLAAAYDVTVTGATLRYRVVQYDEPRMLEAKASNSLLASVDTTTVEVGQDGGCIVNYHAELTLNSAGDITDEQLQQTFDEIGEKAAAGLASALDGTLL